MKRRHIVLLGILAVLVLAALIYTRPMTLASSSAKVDIAQCRVRFRLSFPPRRRFGGHVALSFPQRMNAARSSPTLFAQQKFRRSLANLAAARAAATHQHAGRRLHLGGLSFSFGPTDFP